MTQTYSDIEQILGRSFLQASGDLIALHGTSSAGRTSDLELFRTAFGSVREQLCTNKNYLGFLSAADAVATGAESFHSEFGSFGSGKLHKSLHKSLRRPTFATAQEQVADASGNFLSPQIEIPWRELKRLFDLCGDFGWDKHWLTEGKPSDSNAGPPIIDVFIADLKDLHEKQHALREPNSAWRRQRIRSEAGNDLSAYLQPLGADAGTPAGRTAVMFQIILWLGSMIGQMYKARYNVPRPNVLDPTLEPFIPVPVFSSYPSNHAFQSFLIAEVFSRMVPEHSGASALFHSAWQVAINREFAGLHYRSDTIAGKELARLCAPAIEEVLCDHRRGVRAEWLGESEE